MPAKLAKLQQPGAGLPDGARIHGKIRLGYEGS